MGDVMRILEGTTKDRFVRALEQRGASDLAAVEPTVRRIVSHVRRNRDRALRRYAARWDGLGSNEPVRVPEADLHDAWQRTPPELQEAITQAAGNIRRYCEWQKPQEWRREIQLGVCVGQLVRPLESVGCYVPGGRYPLPSTLLMTVIPAQVADVLQIRVVSPRPAQATLAAAAFLGVREFYRVGGAQAIAALAYGTESIPRVSKIVGPGNRYVTAAKKLVAFDCAIEFLAGPTEAVFISEEGDPVFIGCDLVAQAEHDPDALCVLITSSRGLAKAVQGEVQRRTRANPIAAESLSRRGAILLVDSLHQAVETANRGPGRPGDALVDLDEKRFIEAAIGRRTAPDEVDNRLRPGFAQLGNPAGLRKRHQPGNLLVDEGRSLQAFAIGPGGLERFDLGVRARLEGIEIVGHRWWNPLKLNFGNTGSFFQVCLFSKAHDSRWVRKAGRPASRTGLRDFCYSNNRGPPADKKCNLFC